jgi:hypothetical protein
MGVRYCEKVIKKQKQEWVDGQMKEGGVWELVWKWLKSRSKSGNW